MANPRMLRFPTAAQIENMRRSAECAGVGLVWALFSLPVVTAGAAWIAATTIFDAWTRHEEPPVLRTFLRVIPAQFLAGLAGTVVAVVIGLVTDLDIGFALGARVPGALMEAVALGLVGAAAFTVLLLSAEVRARTGSPVGQCVRAALAMCRDTPWVVPVLMMALGVLAVLAAILPALVLVLAGPMGFAVVAVASRARAL